MRLTYSNTEANITTHCNSSVGRGNPFRLGDNTPPLLAVFLRPSFLHSSLFSHVIHIMMVLFGQSLGLVAPSRGISTPYNTVTNIVENISDGFTNLRLGITA
jgi:hypothetical protein